MEDWMTFGAVVFLVTQQFSLCGSQVNPTEFYSAWKPLANTQNVIDSFFHISKHCKIHAVCYRKPSQPGNTETLVVLSWPVVQVKPMSVFSEHFPFFSGRFSNTYASIYCILYFCTVFFVLSRLCIFILICYVCPSVRTTATEWQLNFS
jgi:hypothetical protein